MYHVDELNRPLFLVASSISRLFIGSQRSTTENQRVEKGNLNKQNSVCVIFLTRDSINQINFRLTTSWRLFISFLSLRCRRWRISGCYSCLLSASNETHSVNHETIINIVIKFKLIQLKQNKTLVEQWRKSAKCALYSEPICQAEVVEDT